MNQEIINQLLSLVPNQKYTICKMGEFGFPFSWKITIKSVSVSKYAQYDNSILLVFVEKGKRKPIGMRFHGDYQQFIIYEGHIDLNTETFVEDHLDGSKSSLLSFSSEYMTRALNSTDQKPIISCLR